MDALRGKLKPSIGTWPGRVSWAAWAAWAALALGYGAMLWLNFPGHMSVDSVIELHEGRFHLRETWGPAIFPWLLGLTDRLWRGTGLYLILSSALLYGGWGLIPILRRRSGWLFPLVVLGAAALPDLLIYQGIVWHDVLFANAAVLGFVALAFAARAWDGPSRPWGPLAASVILLSAAGLVRQNGIVVLPIAAATLTWIAWGPDWRGALLWGLGWLTAAVFAVAVMSVVCLPQGPGFDTADAQGLRVVATYDLVGALAHDPGLDIGHVQKAAPAAAAAMREAAARYSPQRVDFIDDAPGFARRMRLAPRRAVLLDWADLIVKRPALYAALRWDAFRWVFATPDLRACVPIYLGVDGPPKKMRELGLAPYWGQRDDFLFDYAHAFYGTPAISHLAYALLALAALGFVLRRRDPVDRAMAGLLASSLVFAASFLPISIACDYRYIYFLDIAALTGLAYVAVDPRRGREDQAGAKPPPLQARREPDAP